MTDRWKEKELGALMFQRGLQLWLCMEIEKFRSQDGLSFTYEWVEKLYVGRVQDYDE